MDRQRIAEFLQVIRQLVSPGSVLLTLRLSFAEPVTYEGEIASGRTAGLRRDILSRAQVQLSEHLAWAVSEAQGGG